MSWPFFELTDNVKITLFGDYIYNEHFGSTIRITIPVGNSHPCNMSRSKGVVNPWKLKAIRRCIHYVLGLLQISCESNFLSRFDDENLGKCLEGGR
jgi:hypothetical protein